MTTALTAFMNALVDYAGLFPPASLSVPVAVAEYARHRAEPEAWMLGRFIAPAGRLSEIIEVARPHLAQGSAWGFSVLVGDRADGPAALASLTEQGARIAGFEAAAPGLVQVECLEAPIPAGAAAQASAFVPEFLAGLRAAGLGQREVFLELAGAADDAGVLQALAAARPEFSGGADGFARLSAKLRCGGVTADAFPSCERIAAVIHRCAELDLPLKCTAGLHHPVRHRATEPDVMMHGFMNVFGAGLLAWGLQADREVLTACVAETDPSAFTFTDEFFAWRDHRVDVEAMDRIRRQSLSGFGSCSFAEPRSDLQSLGVL